MTATTDWARKQQCGGDHLSKLVLLTLSFYTSWDKGETWVSAETLAAQCETCERTIRRRLLELQDLGFIQILPRPGRSSIIRFVGYQDWHESLPVKTKTPDHQSDVSSHHTGPVVRTPRTASPRTPDCQSDEHSNRTILSNNTTLLREEAKEDSKYNLSDLEKTLTDAAGPCLANPVNSSGLLNLAVPLMWLDQGCDLEKDVLPTLRAFARRDAGKNISTWNYFSRAVAQTKQQREAGLPQVTLKTQNQERSAKPRQPTMHEVYLELKQKEEQAKQQAAKSQEVQQ